MSILSESIQEYPIFEIFDIAGGDWRASQLSRVLHKYLGNERVSPIIPIERVFEQIVLKNARCLQLLRECASWNVTCVCAEMNDETMPIQRVFTRNEELVIVFGNHPYEGYNGTACVSFKYKRLI